ncbi:MAG: hypothetical protein LBS45_06525 [Synergistaceae bacterium]|jgi:hypothetical protein|nr:hypothetical protein [Synergistaceae bacterium]
MSEYQKNALTRVIILISILAAFASPSALYAEPVLGNPAGWTCGELKIVRFDAVSGSQGFWQERDYRTGNGVSLKAILMGGKGPAMLNVPAPEYESADGPLGAGRTYKTFFVGDYPALLERDRFLGISLALKTPDAALTIETPPGPEDEDVIGLALTLLYLM